MKSHLHSLRLNGLNGSNPLAFLATLGAFRSLVETCPEKEIRLSWAPSGNSWAPVLHSAEQLMADELVALLHKHLAARADHPALTVADNLKMPADRFRTYATAAVDAW